MVKLTFGTVWMMVRGKIAAVSYLNTVPFIYGIRHADNLRADLLLSPPSGCAAAFSSHQADIALMPSAALLSNPDAEIVTSYCLGASQCVRTVVVVSNSPIIETKNLYLDAHSLTSVMLTKILCDELWQIKPQMHTMEQYAVVDSPSEGDAFLLIGDKVFGYEGRFKYSYDLADCWRELTGLPFVFAVWVARKEVDAEILDALENALGQGVERTYEAIIELGDHEKQYAYEYLTKNMDFLFDNQKHRALALFWDKGLKFSPRVNPG